MAYNPYTDTFLANVIKSGHIPVASICQEIHKLADSEIGHLPEFCQECKKYNRETGCTRDTEDEIKKQSDGLKSGSLVRCWECGHIVSRKNARWDGSGWYCGC